MKDKSVEKVSVSVVSDQVSIQTIPPSSFTGYIANTANLHMCIGLPYNKAEKLAQMVRTGLHLKITIEYF